MFRIDSDGTAVALRTPDAPGAISGYFNRGNPATSTASTVVSDDWLNAVQEELVNVVLAAPGPPALSKTNRTQVLAAINSLIATGLGTAAPAQHFAENLLIRNTPATPTTKIDVSAERVTILTAAGIPFVTAAFATAVTINSATTGALGLDTGAPANNTAYDVWGITKPDTSAPTCILSLASNTAAGTPNTMGATTIANLPAGYSGGYYMRLGTVLTGGAATFRGTIQSGREVQYQNGIGATTALPQIISGAQGAPATPTWVGTVVTANSGAQLFVPTKARRIKLVLQYGSIPSSARTVMAAPNNTYGAGNSTTNPAPMVFLTNQTSQSNGNFQGDFMLESTSVYYTSDDANGALYCLGWTEPVNAS